MTNYQIEHFLNSGKQHTMININFRKRNSMRGIFVSTSDFMHLKSKNLWRIITESKVNDWLRTRDLDLTRIYNGANFSKLKEL